MTSPSLAPEAEMAQAGRLAGLGEPLSFHHVRPQRTARGLIGPVFFIGSIAIEVLWTVQWFRDPNVWFVWAGLIALFLLFVPLFGAATWDYLTAPPESLSLHSGGLVYRRGAKESVLTWDGISQAECLEKVVTLNGGRVGSVHFLTVQPAGGTAFAVHQTMPGLDGLGPAVVEAVAQRRMHEMLAGFGAGAPVVREYITLGESGIDCAGQFFRYENLGAVELRDQELVLTDPRGKKVYREKVGPWLNSELLAFVLLARALVAPTPER